SAVLELRAVLVATEGSTDVGDQVSQRLGVARLDRDRVSGANVEVPTLLVLHNQLLALDVRWFGAIPAAYDHQMARRVVQLRDLVQKALHGGGQVAHSIPSLSSLILFIPCESGLNHHSLLSVNTSL